MVKLRDLQPGAYIHPQYKPYYKFAACIVHDVQTELDTTRVDLTLDTGERSIKSYYADDEWIWPRLNIAFIPPTPKEKP